MKAPLGLMPAAVRCQPYPFAGITQVRFLRSPRPVGASQPGLPPALEGGERPELPLFSSASTYHSGQGDVNDVICLNRHRRHTAGD